MTNNILLFNINILAFFSYILKKEGRMTERKGKKSGQKKGTKKSKGGKLAKFKNVLLLELNELSQQLNIKLPTGLKVPSVGIDDIDEHVMQMTIRTSLRPRNKYKLVLEALERMDEGTYGICLGCEEPIPSARLEARPWASLCIGCKEAEELLEKKVFRPRKELPSVIY